MNSFRQTEISIMIDMFMLKQQNCKKSDTGTRYRLINTSVCMGDEGFWNSSIKNKNGC